MPSAKLTKRLIDTLPRPTKGETWLWDTEVKGFGLKVLPSGRKAYYAGYRTQGDRQYKKVLIGPHGPLTVEQARQAARQLLGGVAKGSDPAQQRATQKSAATMETAFRQYLDEGRATWQPRTLQEYERQAKTFLLPKLGRVKVADVTRVQVAATLAPLKDRKTLSNRVLFLLSAFFNWAIRTGLRPDEKNPCRTITRHRETGRTRFLSKEELARLGDALKQAESGTWLDEDGQPMPAAPFPSLAAIRLMLLTGCRKSEILTLRWKHVDLEKGELHLQDTKVEDRVRKTFESIRPLSGAAIDLLNQLPKDGPDSLVIPPLREGEKHDPKKVWTRVREVAGLQGVRLHDLRHTFASASQHVGDSLLVTAALLGHRDLDTTRKYAHLIQAPVKAAADRVGGDIQAALDGTSTPVTPLRRPARRRR